jgi:hypothetical protein
MNFYNFGKIRQKTIDSQRRLWHNTDVADTDGENTPASKPLEGFLPEEYRTQRLHDSYEEISPWLLYLSLRR